MYNTLAAHANANAATAGLPPAGQSLRACIAAALGGDNRGNVTGLLKLLSNLDETVKASFCADSESVGVPAVTPPSAPELTARASRWRCPS